MTVYIIVFAVGIIFGYHVGESRGRKSASASRRRPEDFEEIDLVAQEEIETKPQIQEKPRGTTITAVETLADRTMPAKATEYGIEVVIDGRNS